MIFTDPRAVKIYVKGKAIRVEKRFYGISRKIAVGQKILDPAIGLL
jgi:hypothetical protein